MLYEVITSLATDEATTLDALLHAVEEVPGYEYLVTLQPTSPLRTAEDIEGCIAACVAKDAASACSVVEVAKNPYWMFTLGEDQRMRRLLDQNPRITSYNVCYTKLLRRERSADMTYPTVSWVMSVPPSFRLSILFT